MKKKSVKTGNSKILFLVFFFVFLVLAYLIVKPFITVILASAIIAYVLHPLYRRLRFYTGIQWLSATICILLALLIVAIPMFFVATQVVDEGYSVYSSLRQRVNGSDPAGFFDSCATQDHVVCNMYNSLKSAEVTYGVDFSSYVRQGLEAIAAKAISVTTGVIFGLPALMFQVFVMIFLLFFMLVDGHDAVKNIRKLLPLNKDQEKTVSTTFNDLIHATLYGAVLVALVQGTIAGIGFLLFGVEAPFLWGMLTVIAAFVPFVGTGLVWLPVVLKMLVEGMIVSDNFLLWKAIGLGLYCVLLVSSIDNILKPKIIGDRAKLHPAFVLLGVFGGIALFGFVGLFIGPLLLALFIALLKIYEHEKKHY